ncbi:MAG: hypothetical protein IJ404_01470 [Clostridia bacterium]|nr:hypothetical protein [Clostridia bacterium]
MITCTFFGHRDAPWEIKEQVKDAVIDLTTKHGVNTFFVGDSGAFDRIVKSVLTELMPLYNFDLQVILSRIPTVNDSERYNDGTMYVVPEGIETALPRFRIDFRNKYMLNASDYVIAYVEREYGGAFKYYKMAKKRNLTVINLAEK